MTGRLARSDLSQEERIVTSDGAVPEEPVTGCRGDAPDQFRGQRDEVELSVADEHLHDHDEGASLAFSVPAPGPTSDSMTTRPAPEIQGTGCNRALGTGWRSRVERIRGSSDSPSRTHSGVFLTNPTVLGTMNRIPAGPGRDWPEPGCAC